MWVGSMETMYLQLNFAVNIKLLSQTRWFTALRTNTITGSFFSAVCTPTFSGGPRAQREASRCTLRSKAREARVGPPPPPRRPWGAPKGQRADPNSLAPWQPVAPPP